MLLLTGEQTLDPINTRPILSDITPRLVMVWILKSHWIIIILFNLSYEIHTASLELFTSGECALSWGPGFLISAAHDISVQFGDPLVDR